jgi:hypothetical protein
VATGTQEGNQAKALPSPNNEFYELAETRGAEEHALLKLGIGRAVGGVSTHGVSAVPS